MQIVALDGKPIFSNDIDISPLRKLGVVSIYPRTEPGLIRQRLRGADIVLTDRTVLDKEVISSANGLKLICLMGNDFSVVDIETAQRRGIPVCFAPDYASVEMAQHTIGLLLELCLHIGYHDRLIHKGAWCSSQDYCWCEKEPVCLAGKTAGIIGCGPVGCETAKLFKAFGMNVIGYDRFRKELFPGEQVSLLKLFQEADIISLSCQTTADTVGIINSESISMMKTGTMLLNTSSGRLVSEHDIAVALEKGSLGGYGTDTASSEPISVHNPLLRAPNCVISAHCSCANISARRRLVEKTAENISAFLAGKPQNLIKEWIF